MKNKIGRLIRKFPFKLYHSKNSLHKFKTVCHLFPQFQLAHPLQAVPVPTVATGRTVRVCTSLTPGVAEAAVIPCPPFLQLVVALVLRGRQSLPDLRRIWRRLTPPANLRNPYQRQITAQTVGNQKSNIFKTFSI